MLQTGTKPVQRHRPDTCVKIDEVPTQVVRLRDQTKLEWAAIVEGLMKVLLNLEAFLPFGTRTNSGHLGQTVPGQILQEDPSQGCIPVCSHSLIEVQRSPRNPCFEWKRWNVQ